MNAFNWQGPSKLDLPRVKAADQKLVNQRKRRALKKSVEGHNYNNSFNVELPTLESAGKTARIAGRKLT